MAGPGMPEGSPGSGLPPGVKEDEDSVFIEGIPSMRFGEGTDCSFIRSVQLALASLGEIHSYHYLMGISGAAFRIHFHPLWCPSAGDVTAGFDVSRLLFRNLGREAEMVAMDDNRFTGLKNFYGRIVEQVNRGIPVIAINLKVCPEWGIITGYLKNRAGLLCRTYFDGSEAYSRAERAPWLSLFISGNRVGTGAPGQGIDNTSLSKQEILMNSLRQAVRLWETDQFGEYASGASAYLYWIGELREPAPGKEWDGPSGITQGNRMLLRLLLDARKSAYLFLTEAFSDFPIRVGDRICGIYGLLCRHLEEALEKEPPAAPGGPMLPGPPAFQRYTDLLSGAMELEEEVIGLIRKIPNLQLPNNR